MTHSCLVAHLPLAHVSRRPWARYLFAIALWLAPYARAESASADAGVADGKSARAEMPLARSDSPRGSLARYLQLTREGKLEEAAEYLDLPDGADGPRLAQRLKAVLDRHVWFDLSTISDKPEGNRADGLAGEIDEVARVPGKGGRLEPVLLVKRRDQEGARWVFTRATVERIDEWYAQLEDRWIRELLPEPLLRPGPLEVLWWQWIALPLLVVLAWMLSRPMQRFVSGGLVRLVRRTTIQFDDAVVASLQPPVRVGLALLLFRLGVAFLDLYRPAESFLHQLLASLLFVVFFWTILRVVDTVGRLLVESEWAKSYPASRSLIPLGSRLGKVAVVVIGVISVVSALGYPVASLIAGLGIGGLAVALGAQKTLENLFGAFSIGLDQPFREGDFVRVEDFVGTVEAIGLRSTRIRTLDRTTITLPNGRLSDMRLESFATRDRIRLACDLRLVYGTTAAQMRQVLTEVERALRAHPKIWPDAVIVRFKELAESSLCIEVMCWFQADWPTFQEIRQEVLLQFMEIVENAGTSFAIPARMVHLFDERPAPPRRATNGQARAASQKGAK